MLGFEIHRDERGLVAAAALALAASGAGQAMAASAAEGIFLARVGARPMGTLFAGSSLALIATLGVVGALADRRDRARLVQAVAPIGALLITGLALLLPLAPGLASGAALLGGKQVASALDLALWVLIAERMDARQARRLVPLLVAAGGAGTAIGSFAVAPLARLGGAEAALIAGAIAFLLVAPAARAFAIAARARALPGRSPAPRGEGELALPWRGGWQAVRSSGLARHLAAAVGLAGAFAPILYYLLGAAARARYGDAAAIAGFLGRYRGIVQVLVLAAQALLAPLVLARAGVARSLLLAPIGALAAAAALAARGDLAVVAIAQASAKLLDTAFQTPGEKLVQNLLASDVRGRVGGFLDGVAKRAGAVTGGIAASVLVAWPSLLATATLLVAAAWLAAALRLHRRFPRLAVGELAARRDSPDAADAALTLTDPRAVELLRADLDGDEPDRRALAAHLLAELAEQGQAAAAVELADALRTAPPAAAATILAALTRALAAGGAAAADADLVEPAAWVTTGSFSLATTLTVRMPPPLRQVAAALAAALPGLPDGEARARAALLLGRVCAAAAPAAWTAASRAPLEALAADDDPAVRRAAAVGLARARGDRDGAAAALADALAAGDPLAVGELRLDLVAAARELAAAGADTDVAAARMLAAGRSLLRALGDGGTAEERAATLHACAAAIGLGRGAGPRPVELIPWVAAVHDRAAAELDGSDGGDGGDDPATGEARAAALAALAAVGDPGDLQHFARALGDPDERVRRAAADGLAGFGADSLEVLLVAASFGRRAARNAAVGVLRDLRLPAETLDDVAERELTEILETALRLAPLSGLDGGALLVRRLDERIAEMAHTLFLVLEARLASPDLGLAARRYLRARDAAGRARALEAVDALLPRALAPRLLAALDDAAPPIRSARAAERLGAKPLDAAAAVRAELAAGDPLTNSLVVTALGRAGRAAHRDDIRAAAGVAALGFDPLRLARRLAEGAPADPQEEDMPRSVETIVALSRLPLFAELTTRQLEELAGIVHWQGADPGDVLVVEGERGDAMFFVEQGRVRVEAGAAGEVTLLAELGPGEPFGEMALFEDAARTATVSAVDRARIGRIERDDFEDLVHEVPAIALAVCRALGRRVRAMNERVTRQSRAPR